MNDFTVGKAPHALPLIGHGWQLSMRTGQFLDSLPSHGDLVEVKLGRQRALIPCHPEVLRQILVNDRVFDKGGPLWDGLRALIGDGLGSCPHAMHRRQRRLIQPAFHADQLRLYAEVMRHEATSLADSWKDGQIINAFDTLYGCSLRTVTRTLFSSNFDAPVVQQIQDSFEIVTSKIFTRFFTPSIIAQIPTPGNRRYQKAQGLLFSSVKKLVDTYSNSSTTQDDLLSKLLSARSLDGSAGFDDSEISNQIITLLLAGSETAASVLCWALYLLAEHPEIERQLHAEVDQVLAGAPVQWHDLPHLPLTERVLTETMRLYPPSWLLTRTTTQSTELAGHLVEAGTIIGISPYVIQRNPNVFPNPTEFDPDRWLPERASSLPRGAFAAYGGGARKCIGDDFSMLETKIILATIAARWKLSCAPGAQLKPALRAPILHPKRLLLRLHERTGAISETYPNNE